MIDRARHLWAHHRSALMVFALILGMVGFFAIRTVAATVYWMDPAHQDQTVAPWMTPRYIARSYKLPPDVLGPALFLEKDAPPRRTSLDRIAAENGLSLQALQLRIDAAATKWRAQQHDLTP